MPTGAMHAHGIPLALGSDVAAGRTWSIPQIAASAYDNALRVGTSLSPEHLLWLATRGGALALGIPNVGAISPGLDADLVALDVPLWAETADSVLAWILLNRTLPLARRTWVRGQVVWDRHSWARAGGGYPWSLDPRAAPRS